VFYKGKFDFIPSSSIYQVLCAHAQFEVDSPDPSLPDEGRFVVTADFSPAVASKLDRRKLQDMGTQLSSQIYR
jgi:hypothetical protein